MSRILYQIINKGCWAYDVKGPKFYFDLYCRMLMMRFKPLEAIREAQLEIVNPKNILSKIFSPAKSAISFIADCDLSFLQILLQRKILPIFLDRERSHITEAILGVFTPAPLSEHKWAIQLTPFLCLLKQAPLGLLLFPPPTVTPRNWIPSYAISRAYFS